jgi:hypothetical protein
MRRPGFDGSAFDIRDETTRTRRRFVNSDDGFVEMLDAVVDCPDRMWAVGGANGLGRSGCRRESSNWPLHS